MWVELKASILPTKLRPQHAFTYLIESKAMVIERNDGIPCTSVPQDGHWILCPLYFLNQPGIPLCRTFGETSPVLAEFHGRAGVDMLIGP